VNANDQIWVRTGIHSENPKVSGWERVSGALKQIEVGEAGVWGVNANDQIYRRVGITACNPAGDSWSGPIEGALKHISVGKDTIWGVNA